jgi:hypothetical protein
MPCIAATTTLWPVPALFLLAAHPGEGRFT